MVPNKLTFFSWENPTFIPVLQYYAVTVKVYIPIWAIYSKILKISGEMFPISGKKLDFGLVPF